VSIAFDTIPNDVRVPLAYVEFDSTRAQSGIADENYTLLVIGQLLAAATVAAGVPTLVQSGAQGETFFGRGSMLANMINALKGANRHVKTIAIALDDDPAAVAATSTITITGAATASGTLMLYVGGKRVPVPVTSGDSATIVGSSITTAIGADTALPVTSADALGVVTLTARNAGIAGNNIDVRTNYYVGDATPAGLAVAIVAMVGGLTNPDVSTAITAMADTWYQAIAFPYTDTTSLLVLSTELTSRFGGLRQIDGLAYTAYAGTSAITDTFGGTQNSPHISTMGIGASPTPPWIWAAVIAVVAAAALDADPARPMQTLVLPGILPPDAPDRWTFDERDLLLHNGISTSVVDPGGSVMIERLITNYQQNANNIADTSYLNVNTLATLSYIRFATRARITTKYPRYKLAGDTVKVAPGQFVVTPSIIRAEMIALAQELFGAGIIEDMKQFKADLVVQIDANDPDRVNVLSSPNLINQLRIVAEQIQFIL
jgi:phage tail sheath gpL-like